MSIFNLFNRPKDWDRPKDWCVMYASTTNLGDDIQTIAAIEMLQKHGITDYTFVDREQLRNYKGKPIKLIMNGWFIHKLKSFPPPKTVTPIFIGVHIAHPELIAKYKEYWKQHAPIGCRDLHTLQAFKRHDIPAYFSGCLTQAFDEVANKNAAVFRVDTDAQVHYIQHVPIDFAQFNDAKQVTHELQDKAIKFNPVARLHQAQKLLGVYKHARLVITNRLHCALPCRAFNTDVLFCPPNYATDMRFGGLYEYLGNNGVTENGKLNLAHRTVDRAIVNQQRKLISQLFNEAINR